MVGINFMYTVYFWEEWGGAEGRGGDFVLCVVSPAALRLALL